MANFSFNLPKKAVVDFDGKTMFDIEFVRFDARPSGDKFSTRPYLALFYRVKKTGDVFMRKLYVYEVLDTVATDSEGNTYIRKAPQERVRIELSRASGKNFDDIEDALGWIGKGVRKAYIIEKPILDEDGEVRRDDKGVPMKWYDMRFAAQPTAKKEAPAPEMAAEAEAKRAQKGKRGYAGNTGE